MQHLRAGRGGGGGAPARRPEHPNTRTPELCGAGRVAERTGNGARGTAVGFFPTKRNRGDLPTALSDGGRNGSSRTVGIRGHLSLPEPEHEPACILERSTLFSITRHVSFDLRDPVDRVMTRLQPRTTGEPVASMPEVAIHEHDDLRAREDNIGLAGQRQLVLSVTEPASPECAAEHTFRHRVSLVARPASRRRGARRLRLEPVVSGRVCH